MKLDVEPKLANPDDFYQALIDTHRDLDETQSQIVNAKLILLLANHIGDMGVLTEAMRLAREDAVKNIATKAQSRKGK